MLIFDKNDLNSKNDLNNLDDYVLQVKSGKIEVLRNKTYYEKAYNFGGRFLSPLSNKIFGVSFKVSTVFNCVEEMAKDSSLSPEQLTAFRRWIMHNMPEDHKLYNRIYDKKEYTSLIKNKTGDVDATGCFIKGKIEYWNGMVVEGEFSRTRDLALIKGMIKDVNNVVFEGEFDERTGELVKGVKIFPKGIETKLTGTFKDGQLVEGTKQEGTEGIYDAVSGKTIKSLVQIPSPPKSLATVLHEFIKLMEKEKLANVFPLNEIFPNIFKHGAGSGDFNSTTQHYLAGDLRLIRNILGNIPVVREALDKEIVPAYDRALRQMRNPW